MATVAGGVIDIEHSEDTSATDPTYTVVGKTRGTVAYSPNANIASSEDDHSTRHTDKASVGAAWEMEFTGKVLSTLGGLETLGLYDSTNGEIKESVDHRPDDSAGVRITVYEDEAAQSAGEHLLQFGPINDCLLELGAYNVEADDFSTWEATLHIRQNLPAAGDGTTTTA